MRSLWIALTFLTFAHQAIAGPFEILKSIRAEIKGEGSRPARVVRDPSGRVYVWVPKGKLPSELRNADVGEIASYYATRPLGEFHIVEIAAAMIEEAAENLPHARAYAEQTFKLNLPPASGGFAVDSLSPHLQFVVFHFERTHLNQQLVLHEMEAEFAVMLVLSGGRVYPPNHFPGKPLTRRSLTVSLIRDPFLLPSNAEQRTVIEIGIPSAARPYALPVTVIAVEKERFLIALTYEVEQLANRLFDLGIARGAFGRFFVARGLAHPYGLSETHIYTVPTLFVRRAWTLEQYFNDRIDYALSDEYKKNISPEFWQQFEKTELLKINDTSLLSFLPAVLREKNAHQVAHSTTTEMDFVPLARRLLQKSLEKNHCGLGFYSGHHLELN